MNPDTSTVLIICGAAAATLPAAACVLLAVRRVLRRMDFLQAEVARVLEAQQPLGARLEALAAVVQEEPVRAATAFGTDRAYELAVRLASGGVGCREIVAQCGLTPAEAELVVRVHGPRGTRPSAA